MSARKQIHVFPKMSNTSFEICECLWGRLWVTRRTELGPCRQDDLQWIAMIPLNGLPAIHLPPLLFFQCGIWQQRRWGFSAFVREKRAEWKGAVDSHFFAPIRGPGTADTSTTAAWNHWERCVGLWEGDLLFFLLPSLVCRRELRVALLSTRLRNVIPPDCRCKAPTSHRQMRRVCKMPRECSLLCMHVSSQHRRTPKMYSGVYVKFI